MADFVIGMGRVMISIISPIVNWLTNEIELTVERLELLESKDE